MKSKFGLISLILSIVAILFPFVYGFEKINGEIIFITVMLVLSIVAIVLGFLGKKDDKGKSIAGIVIGFLGVIYLALALLGFYTYTLTTDCVDNGNETAKCMINGIETDGIPTMYLTEDQMSKETEE